MRISLDWLFVLLTYPTFEYCLTFWYKFLGPCTFTLPTPALQQSFRYKTALLAPVSARGSRQTLGAS